MERDQRGLERVHAAVGRASGVGGLAEKADVLADVRVRRAAERELGVLGARRRVDHHGQVHAIERAEPDELLLAGEEAQLPLPSEVQTVFDVHELLGGDGHQLDVSTERAPHFGHSEADGGADHDADLRVVAAGVGRSGHRVGKRVAGHRQRVELAQYGHRRAIVAAAQAGGDARDRHVICVLDSQFVELLADEAGSLKLAEAQFGTTQGLFGDVDDPVAATVDGGLGGGLQGLGTGHSAYVSSE